MTYLCSIYTSSWLTDWREDLSWLNYCLSHSLSRAQRRIESSPRLKIIKRKKSGEAWPLKIAPTKAPTCAVHVCTASVCVYLAVYTDNKSVSWRVITEVMLDSMNVRIMYWDQHEEIWLRGREILVSAQLCESHPQQKPDKTACQFHKGLELNVIFIID